MHKWAICHLVPFCINSIAVGTFFHKCRNDFQCLHQNTLDNINPNFYDKNQDFLRQCRGHEPVIRISEKSNLTKMSLGTLFAPMGRFENKCMNQKL